MILSTHLCQTPPACNKRPVSATLDRPVFNRRQKKIGPVFVPVTGKEFFLQDYTNYE